MRRNRRRTIASITGTRADFGLMTPVLEAIARSPRLRLSLYATGMHLMPVFGLTIREVKKKFPSARMVSAVFPSTDRPSKMVQFAADYLHQLTKVWTHTRPDLVLVLGDRIEMLCTALAAAYLGIPLAHIHGGEVTTTVDEPVRHAISKLSHLHFAATARAARRVMRMGEEPWRVYAVGAPALDVALRARLPHRDEICRICALDPRTPFLLITQYPVSEHAHHAGQQMEETLAAARQLTMPAVIIYPNADPGGQRIISVIEKNRRHPLFRIVPSLPHEHFLALERESAAWIGNSSAAMIESASFRTPVVNIGERQRGREHGNNVINAGYDRTEIAAAVKHALFNRSFRARLQRVKNPWGDGRASARIVRVLERLPSPHLLLRKRMAY